MTLTECPLILQNDVIFNLEVEHLRLNTSPLNAYLKFNGIEESMINVVKG